MANRWHAVAPYVAAGVLATITCLVFFSLRDFGPESAVRRFQDDIRNERYGDLVNVTTTGTLNDPYVGVLGRFLRNEDSMGASSRIVATDLMSANKANVLTLLEWTDGRQFVVWVTTKEPNQGWKVDPQQTVAATTAVWQNGLG